MTDEGVPICYLGHENCYDNHTAERLADEADWEQERREELGYMEENLAEQGREAIPPAGVPQDAVLVQLPYSEVCMHMGVAGTKMWVVPVGHNMAQLYDLEGRKFSMPITCGEAGIPRDHLR